MKPKHLLAVLVALLTLSACKRTDIRNVIKSVASLPVDTVGYSYRAFQLGSFNAIEIDCFADVTYRQVPLGNPYRMSISAPGKLLDNLVHRVTEEGKLVVEYNHRYNASDKVVPVIRIEAPAVNSFELCGGKCLRLGTLKAHAPVDLTLSGVGAIICDTLQSPDVDAVLNGAGTLLLKGIQTERMRAQLSGAGLIELEGRATHSWTHCDGAGVVDTTALKR